MRRIADTQRECFSRHQPAKPPINHLPKGEIYIGKIASAGSHWFLRLRSVSGIFGERPFSALQKATTIDFREMTA